MDELSIITAVILGLLGSSHCLGMCGGLSAILGLNGGEQQTRRLSRLLSYNSGRLLTYALIGCLAGLVGNQLSLSPLIGMTLRGIAGLLLITMGLYVAGWWLGLTRLEAMGTYLWRYIQPFSQKLLPIKNNHQALCLGVLWGLLPCGLVYSILAWALAAADWRQSGLLMLAFGIGTLPAMLATGLASQQVLNLLRKQQARMLAGSFIIALGLFTLVMPWTHIGHQHHEQQSPQGPHTHHNAHH